MRRGRILAGVVLLALALAMLFLGGCVKTGYQRFVDKGKQAGWTKEQIEAAYDYFLKSEFMTKGEDGRYTIDTTKISAEDAYQMAGNILNDLDHVLGTDDPEWQRLLRAMPTAKLAFEREEQRWLYIQSQLGQVKTYFDFQTMLGEQLTDKDKEYRIAYLWPANVHTDFTADYLEKAKAAGKLREVEREFVYLYTPYGYKDPDPEHPDDANAFVWRAKLQGYVIVSYAILNSKPPDSLRADYCEVYRANVSGTEITPESKPCLRAFRKLNGQILEVVVLDYDREGEAGFGVPDKVESVYASTGSALYARYPSLFETLAESRAEQAKRDRTYTEQRPTLQIVHVGEAKEWKGDFNPDGWTVPYEYHDQYGVDWTARIVKQDKPEGYPFDRIKYVVKVWKKNSVWEYYAPTDAYIGEMEIVLGGGHNVYIQPKGKAQRTVYADDVCGSLRMIIYRDGSEWVKLVDLDGTGKLQYRIIGVPNPSEVSSSAGSEHSIHGW